MRRRISSSLRMRPASMVSRHPHRRPAVAVRSGFRRNTQVQHEPFGVALGGQPLRHSFSSKVVNERPFLGGEMPPNYSEALPNRSMGEKPSNQCVSIGLGFCKEQSHGRKAIDTMYDKRSLPLRFQFYGNERKCGRRYWILSQAQLEVRQVC
jgi:hypothetical protein